MPTLTATYEGDLRIRCRHEQSGAEVLIDAPVDNHGKGESFSPTDLCAAALASCAMNIFGVYGRENGYDFTGTRMDINKSMQAEPRRIARLEIIFHMPPRNYPDEVKQHLQAAIGQ